MWDMNNNQAITTGCICFCGRKKKRVVKKHIGRTPVVKRVFLEVISDLRISRTPCGEVWIHEMLLIWWKCMHNYPILPPPQGVIYFFTALKQDQQ
jgi:hypothetical protein